MKLCHLSTASVGTEMKLASLMIRMTGQVLDVDGRFDVAIN